MARLIPLMDAKKRDAHVAAEWAKKPPALKMVGPSGTPARLERLIRTTDATAYDALLRAHGDDAGVARALIDGDPEIDLHLVGRRLGDAARVYLRPDGAVLSVARVLRVVRGPDGAERSREDFLDVEATLSEESAPMVWTGKLVPIAEAIRKFAFTKQLQLRHVSGLTFQFLYDIAKELHAAKKMVFVGTGPKGQGPLIFTTNGAPYRGFLEGRVDGDAYRLVLHLSNLELKSTGGAS
jgi:hypothetical protein